MNCSNCKHSLDTESRFCPQCGTALHVPPPSAAGEPKAQANLPEPQWYYENNGQSVGPVTESALRAQILASTLSPSTQVWTKGLAAWIAAEKTPLTTNPSVCLPAKSTPEWYYVQAGQKAGPVTEDQIRSLIKAGSLASSTLVWKKGLANWVSVSNAIECGGIKVSHAAGSSNVAFPAPRPARLSEQEPLEPTESEDSEIPPHLQYALGALRQGLPQAEICHQLQCRFKITTGQAHDIYTLARLGGLLKQQAFPMLFSQNLSPEQVLFELRNKGCATDEELDHLDGIMNSIVGTIMSVSASRKFTCHEKMRVATASTNETLKNLSLKVYDPQKLFGKALFSFKGKIGRKQFWQTIGCLLGVNMVVTMMMGLLSLIFIGDARIVVLVLITIAFLPFTVWLSLATQVKRWHDLGKSGWMVLINLIPLVGPIWSLVELGFREGES